MKLLKNIFLTLAALLFSLSFANAGEKWDILVIPQTFQVHISAI